MIPWWSNLLTNTLGINRLSIMSYCNFQLSWARFYTSLLGFSGAPAWMRSSLGSASGTNISLVNPAKILNTRNSTTNQRRKNHIFSHICQKSYTLIEMSSFEEEHLVADNRENHHSLSGTNRDNSTSDKELHKDWFENCVTGLNFSLIIWMSNKYNQS